MSFKECETKDGFACVFPSTYKGNTYDGCNTARYNDNGVNRVGPLCSTYTDRYGVHVSNFYGVCSSDCTKIDTGITGHL